MLGGHSSCPMEISTWQELKSFDPQKPREHVFVLDTATLLSKVLILPPLGIRLWLYWLEIQRQALASDQNAAEPFLNSLNDLGQKTSLLGLSVPSMEWGY